MKKLFLFVAVAALTLSLNSCSSDSGGGSTVSFKVNGTTKKFKTYAVEESGYVVVFGYIGDADDPTEEVSFVMPAGATGSDAIDSFSYDNETDSYYPLTYTTNVTVNGDGKAKGTFSGTLEPFSGGSNLTITDGTFSVSY